MKIRVVMLLWMHIFAFFNFIEIQSSNHEFEQSKTTNTVAAQNNLSESPRVTLYQTYVWTKEILYIYLALPFLGYYDIAKTAKMYCCQCGGCVDSFELYCALIARGESNTIMLLKKYWKKGSVSNVERFMCKSSNELCISCIPCLAHHGWCTTEKAEGDAGKINE